MEKYVDACEEEEAGVNIIVSSRREGVELDGEAMKVAVSRRHYRRL